VAANLEKGLILIAGLQRLNANFPRPTSITTLVKPSAAGLISPSKA
jgi:hypothetical protein